jgi:hypothetical protein
LVAMQSIDVQAKKKLRRLERWEALFMSSACRESDEG